VILNKSEILCEAQHIGGSQLGKVPNKNRDFAAAFDCFVNDYFSDVDSINNETDFERRFCFPPSIFKRIYEKKFGLFLHHCDALGKHCIYPLICTFACF
jgi:hypothetical protein